MKVAVLGAGHVGPVIARLALAAGHEVAVAGSGDPARIEMIVDFLAPGARPRTTADAGLVVLAIPWHRFGELDPAPFAGKVVVDAMNHWPPADRARGGAGDDPAALVLVAELLAGIGFDPVPVGALAAGRLLEPGSPVFGGAVSRSTLEGELQHANPGLIPCSSERRKS